MDCTSMRLPRPWSGLLRFCQTAKTDTRERRLQVNGKAWQLGAAEDSALSLPAC